MTGRTKELMPYEHEPVPRARMPTPVNHREIADSRPLNTASNATRFPPARQPRSPSSPSQVYRLHAALTAELLRSANLEAAIRAAREETGLSYFPDGTLASSSAALPLKVPCANHVMPGPQIKDFQLRNTRPRIYMAGGHEDHRGRFNPPQQTVSQPNRRSHALRRVLKWYTLTPGPRKSAINIFTSRKL